MSLCTRLRAAVCGLALGLILMVPACSPVQIPPPAEAATAESRPGTSPEPPRSESFLRWMARASGPIGLVILGMSFYLVAVVVWMGYHYRRSVALPELLIRDLNDLLAESSALPQLTDHDGVWHFHFTPPESSLVAHMAAEAAMGLASVIRDHGLERLRVCAATGCSRVFVDTSRNRSRRYCNPDICGNRTNVAAFRARQRAAGASG